MVELAVGIMLGLCGLGAGVALIAGVLSLFVFYQQRND